MKKNKKKLVIYVMVLIVVFLLLPQAEFVRKFSQRKTDGNSAEKKSKVALITKSTTSAFWKSVRAGAENASTAYNMELLFEGPDNEEDYETQNEMIENAVNSGVDAIIFSAVDYNANAQAINEAAGQGIPVVIIDSDVNSDMAACRIGTDNYNAGCMAAQAVLEKERDSIKVGIVNFDKNSENGQKREQGFRDTVEKDKRVSIVDTVYVRSTVEDARTGTEKMLETHPEINTIVTFNEWTSLGVGYAIQEAELKNEVEVVAFDSNVVSVGMLETGEVDALIVQNPYAMGYLGMEAVHKALNGHTLQNERIDTDTMLVTRDNMFDEECQRMLFAFEKK